MNHEQLKVVNIYSLVNSGLFYCICFQQYLCVIFVLMNIDLTALLNLERININAAVQNAVEQNEVRIIALNHEQLDSGIDAESASLGQYKNFKYKGRFSPVDLKLKNDFRKAEDLKIDANGFEFVDNDFKTPFLTKRYGKNILGLTDQNAGVTARMIENDVIDNLKNQLS